MIGRLKGINLNLWKTLLLDLALQKVYNIMALTCSEYCYIMKGLVNVLLAR